MNNELIVKYTRGILLCILFVLTVFAVNQLRVTRANASYSCLPGSCLSAAGGGAIYNVWTRSSSGYCSYGDWSYPCSGTDSVCSGLSPVSYNTWSDCNDEVNGYTYWCCDSSGGSGGAALNVVGPASCSSTGHIKVNGWVCSSAGGVVIVYVYIDGEFVTQFMANLPGEEAIGAYCKGTTDHRFSYISDLVYIGNHTIQLTTASGQILKIDQTYTTATVSCPVCTPATECDCSPLSNTAQGYGYKSTSCSDGCGGTINDMCYCYKCSLDSCPSKYATTGQGYGNLVYDTCTNTCNVTSNRICYCYQCTLPSCPSGTSTSGTHGYYSTIDCENDCGEGRSDTCHCTSACTDLDSCPSKYSTTAQGYGNLIYDTCTNKCGESRNRTCYCYQCIPTCDAGTTSDLEEAGEFIGTKTCTNDCGVSNSIDCYTINAEPVLDSVEIVPAATILAQDTYSTNNLFSKIVNRIKAQELFTEDVMGYTSQDHSGIESHGVNNPVGLQAQYTDTDGVSDIEALYIWFDPSTIKDFSTPDGLQDLEAQTETSDSWGFMVATDGNIYIPHITDTEQKWTDAILSGESYYILGPDGKNMVELSNVSIEEVDSDTLQLNTMLKFLSGSADDAMTSLMYHVWGMADDYVGLTYENNDTWEDSGEEWYIDLENPVVSGIELSSGAEEEINLSFTAGATDGLGLAYIRVDACGSDIVDPSDLGTANNPSYELQSCSDFNLSEDIDVTSSEDLLYGTPSTEPLGIDELSPTLTISLGDNDSGSITFHITAMDEGGNVDGESITYRLGDWVIVENGLTYGGSGVSSPTRPLEEDAWDSSTSEIAEYGSFTALTADLTDQVLLGGNSDVASFLGILEKVAENNSFKVSSFSGVSLSSPYNQLMVAYETKKLNDNYTFVEVNDMSNLTDTSLSSICEGEFDICVVNYDGDINVGDFTCDGKGLITASGDVSIDPEFKSDSDSDACIILSGADINIGSGENLSGASVNYDTLEAFMIANGNINIGSDSSYNGLIVEGGLVAFSKLDDLPGILNSRSILVGPRTTYPVIAVDNNAKYGLLSKILFGSQIDIFKTEIGFKPY